MARTIPTVCLLLLLTGWQAQQADSMVVTAVMEAVQMASQIYDAVQKIRELFEPDSTADEQLTGKDLMIFDKLDNIAGRIEKFENRLFSTLSQNFEDKLTKKTNDIHETIDFVDELYSKFLDYSKNLTLNKNEMHRLFNTTFGDGFNDPSHRIVRMHSILAKYKEESLLHIIISQKEPELMCRRQQTIQQIAWQMYQTVVTYDLKVISLKLMSMQFMYNDTLKFQYNAGLELTQFERRNNATYKNILQYMPLASRDLWKCDPPRYIKDSSYSKLQEIFQAIIANEQDTDLDKCSYDVCEDLNTHEVPDLYEPNSYFAQEIPEKLRCSGRLTNWASTAEDFDFCIALPSDDRRYEGLKTTRTYGHYESDCRRNHHLEYENGFFKACSFCLSTCLSNKLDVDRYFSLEPAESSVTENKVVTGVRLRNINYVFYIEIQEGFLGANGTIEGKPNWMMVPNNRMIDIKEIWNVDPENRDAEPIPNDDVYAVHWDQRTVYLDDIELDSRDKDLVVTGIRFNQLSDALYLQVRLSLFNYTTGEILGEGDWFDNVFFHDRRKINLDKVDDPLKYESHIIDSTTGQYVKFQTTDYESNMGQLTIPFLDMQEVVTNPPMPLSGAGLYHKGERYGKSGGFLGLKLIQYDISKHLLLSDTSTDDNV